MIFDLREEEEHLLGAYDFFNWYTAEGRTLTKDLGILKDLLREGVVYSYDMIDAPSDSLVSTEDSQLALLGISVVRHQDELSVILLAGENLRTRRTKKCERVLLWVAPFPARKQ